MINLIDECNKIIKKHHDIKVLQKELESLIDDHLKSLCPYRNASIWLEIFSRLTSLNGYVSDTIIEGVIKRAVKKFKKTPDTHENLVLAIAGATHYNNLIRLDIQQTFDFVRNVERALSDAFNSMPIPQIRTEWRSTTET